MLSNRSLSKLLPVGGALVAALFSACAPVDDADPTEQGSDEVRLTGSQYVRLRHDDRRCVSPVCGGYWVSRVSQRTTRCADGSWQRECYVAEADWSGLGLDEASLERFRGAATNGHAVVRARIVPKTYGSFGDLGQLVALEGFEAVTDADPSGTFVLAHGPTRICVRAPCFSWDADKLNGITVTPVSEVPFAGVTGIARGEVRRAQEQLNSAEGVVVAGAFQAVAGGGRALVPSQVYLRVSPGVSEAAYCNADAECTIATRNRDVGSASDCYCALCPSTPLNVSTAERYSSRYDRHCAAFRRTCPVARCIVPPPAACVNHACVARPRP